MKINVDKAEAGFRIGVGALPPKETQQHPPRKPSRTQAGFFMGDQMKCCKDCKHFTDAHYSNTYISPTCTQRGTDSAVYMRQHVCGVENPTLYEQAPKPVREGADNHGSRTQDRRQTEGKP